MDLLDELETRVLCGDGAIGTLLIEAGIPLTRSFEELCVSEPDRIGTIHERYVSAGARVIKTNTFGGNAVRLERFGLQDRVSEINRAAVRLAERAAKGGGVYIAGNVGPLGISGQEAASRGIDRVGCFREQISALLDSGVDVIFFETFTDLEEMTIALQAKNECGDVPEICSFACAPEGWLASGVRLMEALAKLQELGAKMMGVNCMNDPRGTVQLLQGLPGKYRLAAYPNAGAPRYQEGRFVYPIAPDCFAESTGEMVAHGARLIGGCCGTTPAHVTALAAAAKQLSAHRG